MLVKAAIVIIGSTAVYLIAATRVSGPTAFDDGLTDTLQERYGPKVSQGPEEWLILDFFKGRRNGVFVDVGAFEARDWSNTFTLEAKYEWSGLAIDAIEEFRAGYDTLRPRTIFDVAFVGDRDTGTQVLHINPKQPAVSSVFRSFTQLWGTGTFARAVPARTLDSLLAEHSVGHFDLLSMDIELGEPAALKHFSIDRYRPELVVVEAHPATRQFILDYFARADYTVVGRYLWIDRVNLYFTPLNDAPPTSVDLSDKVGVH